MSRNRRTVADEPFLVVRSTASDHGSGSRIAAHQHDWHQLVYVAAGLTTVSTASGTWVAPPSRAVWVPADTDHALRFVGRSTLRTLYLRPDGGALVPDCCQGVEVSPLLRELVLRVVDLGMLDRREPEELALATVIAAEIGSQPRADRSFTLPEPTSESLQRVARMVRESPSPATTAVLARAAGLSVRTLERRFRAETGNSLGRWRQQSMLLRGLERTALGEGVSAAAASAGYRSASAYVAAFRTVFGTTPGRYFPSRHPGIGTVDGDTGRSED